MSIVLFVSYSTPGSADPGSSCQPIQPSDQAAVLQATGRSTFCVRCRLGSWCPKHWYAPRPLPAKNAVSHIPRSTCRTAMWQCNWSPLSQLLA